MKNAPKRGKTCVNWGKCTLAACSCSYSTLMASFMAYFGKFVHVSLHRHDMTYRRPGCDSGHWGDFGPIDPLYQFFSFIPCSESLCQKTKVIFFFLHLNENSRRYSSFNISSDVTILYTFISDRDVILCYSIYLYQKTSNLCITS